MNVRRLVVNADDFGIAAGVNRGIVEAHERGIVTSTSLMVRRAAAAEAAAYARASARLGVGLHLELGEWAHGEAGWYATREIVDLEDADAVHTEVDAQIAEFRELVSRGPTHVDSHQHVHRSEPVASVAQAAARRLGVPLRHRAPAIRYRGDFYGQTATGASLPELITVDALVTLVESLPFGMTELACHPGYADGLDSSYASERELELRALCDPKVRDAIAAHGVLLCSFKDFGR